jgi:hypothetical protein
MNADRRGLPDYTYFDEILKYVESCIYKVELLCADLTSGNGCEKSI